MPLRLRSDDMNLLLTAAQLVLTFYHHRTIVNNISFLTPVMERHGGVRSTTFSSEAKPAKQHVIRGPHENLRLVPLWERTCPAHVCSVRSLLTTTIGRSLSRERHLKHDSGRAAITVLCTDRQSHSLRENPAVAHHCIPECANNS